VYFSSQAVNKKASDQTKNVVRPRYAGGDRKISPLWGAATLFSRWL
jgi:hypothetical protein